jgi:hypothetical protein
VRGRSSLNGARGGRSKRLIYSVVLVLCVLWTVLIVAAASLGGSPGASQDAGSGSAPEARPAGQSQADGSEGVGQEAGTEGGARDYEQVEREADDPQNGAGRPEGQDAGDGQKREASGTRLPQEAAFGEPAYDPLGKGASAGDLSETDKGRVELAASRFVDAAYDFEGVGSSARVSYVEDVNWTVDSPEFWESPQSPGGRAIESVARRTEEYGVKNQATFREFRIDDTSLERVIGTAVFALDEGEGEKTYHQQLVLRRWAAVWRVLHAKQIEEVS